MRPYRARNAVSVRLRGKMHSQNEEEKYILQAVGDNIGRFLEIGSWHATDKSNTRTLLERGWTGLMIEPSPGPFLNILRSCSNCGATPAEIHGERKAPTCECGSTGRYGNDPRLDLICAAVAVGRTGLLKLHATDDAVSTSEESGFERWKSIGGYYGSFWTPIISLQQILNQFGDFDFVSIDSEGTSVDLFIDLLRFAMRPKCICVEYDDRLAECTDAAGVAGYRQVYRSGENCVFSL